MTTAADIISAATAAGLEYHLASDARGPFVAVYAGNAKIDFSGYTYVFPDMYALFFYRADQCEVIRAVGIRQYNGDIAHPHSGNSAVGNFCFGGNANAIQAMCDNENQGVQLLSTVLYLCKLYTSGAYSQPSSLEHVNKFCKCRGGERVCNQCKSICPISGITGHVSEFTPVGDLIVHNSVLSSIDYCSCGKAKAIFKKQCTACEEKGCNVCKRTVRERPQCHMESCPRYRQQ